MTNITDILFELARQHSEIRAFRYDSVAESGTGAEAYPLLWLEEPLFADNNDARLLRVRFNFSVTAIPETKNEVSAVQKRCFAIGLSVIEKMRTVQDQTLLSVASFNALTLREYYDNASAGARFSVAATLLNPQDLCRLNEVFDPAKSFPNPQQLPRFANPDNGCALFPEKPQLPSFDLK